MVVDAPPRQDPRQCLEPGVAGGVVLDRLARLLAFQFDDQAAADDRRVRLPTLMAESLGAKRREPPWLVVVADAAHDEGELLFVAGVEDVPQLLGTLAAAFEQQSSWSIISVGDQLRDDSGRASRWRCRRPVRRAAPTGSRSSTGWSCRTRPRAPHHQVWRPAGQIVQMRDAHQSTTASVASFDRKMTYSASISASVAKCDGGRGPRPAMARFRRVTIPLPRDRRC